jgi:hypothetical protein
LTKVKANCGKLSNSLPMSPFERLRHSQISLFTSLFAVVWLALAPLAQAIPVGTSDNGLPRFLVVCTSMGITTINTQQPNAPLERNNNSQSSTCVVCTSLQVLAKILPPAHIELPKPALNGFLRSDEHDSRSFVSSSCTLPEARAPPSPIHV